MKYGKEEVEDKEKGVKNAIIGSRMIDTARADGIRNLRGASPELPETGSDYHPSGAHRPMPGIRSVFAVGVCVIPRTKTETWGPHLCYAVRVTKISPVLRILRRLHAREY